MEKQLPKKIRFVNWKRHKLDRALESVDAITRDLFEEMVYKAVFDYFRQNKGYPCALPIDSITSPECVRPSAPRNIEQIPNGGPPLSRSKKCPVCGSMVDGPRLTEHLATCIRGCNAEETAIRICKSYETV